MNYVLMIDRTLLTYLCFWTVFWLFGLIKAYAHRVFHNSLQLWYTFIERLGENFFPENPSERIDFLVNKISDNFTQAKDICTSDACDKFHVYCLIQYKIKWYLVSSIFLVYICVAYLMLWTIKWTKYGWSAK